VARLNVTGPEPTRPRRNFSLRIAPRQPPHRFPVLMWGVWDPREVLKEMGRLKQIGFNHVFGVGADNQEIWKAEADAPPKKNKNESRPRAGDAATVTNQAPADEALANDMTIVATSRRRAMLTSQREFQRASIARAPYKKEPDRFDVCGLIPKIGEFLLQRRGFVPRTYGRFRLRRALLHTEVRDNVELCSKARPSRRSTRRQAATFRRRPSIEGRRYYHAIPGFLGRPRHPRQPPVYVFYRWFWRRATAGTA